MAGSQEKRRYSKENECLRFFYAQNFFSGTRRKRGKMPRIFLLNGKKAKRLLRFVRYKEISC
jgi:hypothetical protein